VVIVLVAVTIFQKRISKYLEINLSERLSNLFGIIKKARRYPSGFLIQFFDSIIFSGF